MKLSEHAELLLQYAEHASEGRWRRARHLEFLAEQIARLYRGEIKRLCVSMPPRHGKSELISKWLPTFWLGVRPNDRVVLSSYARDLTKQWSMGARDIFAQWAPELFDVTTRQHASAVDWNVFKDGRRTGGGLYAVGKGGALTGKGADLLICDDLIKDSAEAQSPTQRKACWEWFRSVALTRLMPGARAIMVMTRWHHGDPVGLLEQQQIEGNAGEPWTFINLPAIALEDDAIGRPPGEALWPERYSLETLNKIRKDVGPYVWEALYQGSPTPTEGALFKKDWLRFGRLSPDGRRYHYSDSESVEVAELLKFGTSDLAVSTKESADFTVVMCWGLDKKRERLILLDVIRARVEGPEIVPVLRDAVDSWKLSEMYMEHNGVQLSLIQHAQRDGLPIRPIKPDRDKVSRAMPATAALEAGQVWLRETGWTPALVRELMEFPHGDHDDQVDALSYAVQVFRGTLRVLNKKRSRGERLNRWRADPWSRI